MSNFICEHCGAECIDTPEGYITGCEHYPVEAMTTNKPEVKRYDCTSGGSSHCYGCYTMTETEDGEYVSAEDFEALQAECEKLRKDAERYRWMCDGNGYFLEHEMLCGFENEKAEADAAIDAAMQEDSHDNQ